VLKPISVVVKTDSKDRAHKVGGGARRLYSITICKYKKYQTKINVPPISAIYLYGSSKRNVSADVFIAVDA